MLGVLPASRARGVGHALKLAQRARTLAHGIELVEWTFDPLQAVNAHLNVARLGAVASTYLRDAYGALDGDLHRGTPTDRLVAEWWITRPHVRRRIDPAAALTARSADVMAASAAIDTRWSASGRWLEVEGVLDDVTAGRIEIAVPPEFTAMQQEALDLAQTWRQATRLAFERAFAKGYRVVDFHYDRERGGGRYLLATAG
jgi:predicted GNAT superfamily acetyltransferase